MLTGFRCTRDIPESCREPWTVVSDEPLTTIPEAFRRHGYDVECCAAAGHGSEQALTWLEAVEPWWDRPAIIWVGRNDFRTGCKQTAATVKAMIDRLRGEWWVCSIPNMPREENRITMFDRCNSELRELAGDRFLDPLHAIGGERVLPARLRLDRTHPTSEANELIADWLIANTVGKSTAAQAA